MLPENETPSSIVNTLFFCYNRQRNDILYTNAPIGIFLSSTDKDAGADFFSSECWRNAQALTVGEETNFSFTNTEGSGHFDCHIKAVDPGGGSGASLLMCSVSRQVRLYDQINKQEFEEFIHLAAHDLDAPLRKLNLLIERMTAKINPDAEEAAFIPRIQANISDIRGMIDGLTKLAKSSFKGDTVAIDATKLITDVAENFRERNPDKHIELRVGPMPILQGDGEAYRELFNQLIANAVIFSGNKSVFIDFSSAEPDNEEERRLGTQNGIKFCKITVRDGGIGFDQSEAEKIFQPFVRLHGKSEYPGSGLGLAICKKIVESHGGQIYGCSAEKNGAQFIFYLPQSQINA